jgi:hypothetical protein
MDRIRENQHPLVDPKQLEIPDYLKGFDIIKKIHFVKVLNFYLIFVPKL